MGLASELIQKVTLGAKTIESSVIQGVGTATEFIRKNPVTSGVTVAGGLLAGATIVQIARKRKKKKTATRKAPRKHVHKHVHHIKKKSRTKVRGKKWYGKTRSKTIHTTKKGQPYVILSDGRARFIKKSRARDMRKRKGGYR